MQNVTTKPIPKQKMNASAPKLLNNLIKFNADHRKQIKIPSIDTRDIKIWDESIEINYEYYTKDLKKIKIPDGATNVGFFERGYAKYVSKGKLILLNPNGKKIPLPDDATNACVCPPGHIAYKKNDKWALLDPSGKIKLVENADRIYVSSTGHIQYRKNNKWTLLNPQLTEIPLPDKATDIHVYSTGHIEYQLNKAFTLLDPTGKTQILENMDRIYVHSTGHIQYRKNNKWTLLNPQLTEMLLSKDAVVADNLDYNPTTGHIRYETHSKYGKCGILYPDGKEIPFDPYAEDKRLFSRGHIRYKLRGEYKLLDPNGKEIPLPKRANTIIVHPTKYTEYQINDKWTLLDPSGKIKLVENADSIKLDEITDQFYIVKNGALMVISATKIRDENTALRKIMDKHFITTMAETASPKTLTAARWNEINAKTSYIEQLNDMQNKFISAQDINQIISTNKELSNTAIKAMYNIALKRRKTL